MLSRRSFCKLLVVGFMAGLMNDSDDDDDDGECMASFGRPFH